MMKNDIIHCLVERGRERRVIEPTSFLSPFKIQSLQIGKKIEMKSEKNICTKLPYLFKRSFFFFFSFVTLPFVFCFFSYLFFSFFGFFFFSFLFFFLIFIFIIFLKKKLLDDFLCYFLKCPLSSIHKRYDGKFIQTLFSTKPKSFLFLHFSILLTKYKREKLKTFLSSHFSILPLFSIFLLFNTHSQTVPKE